MSMEQTLLMPYLNCEYNNSQGTSNIDVHLKVVHNRWIAALPIQMERVIF